ncbi:MAG: hypothetical protein SVK54_04405 [candidate division WOR-3 bacterium]|nr:hypothetical protein [candidate division WOR-3 bacterium]
MLTSQVRHHNEAEYAFNRAELNIVSNNLDFSDIDPAEDSIVILNGLILSVRSDYDWKLTIYAEDDFMSDKGYVIPAENLLFSTRLKPYRNIEKHPVTIITGSRTNRKSEQIIIDFKFDLKNYNTAGIYSTKLYLELEPIH